MKIRNHFFWIAAVIGLIIDQITKIWTVQTFVSPNPESPMVIIPGVLNFTYVLNQGAAWGICSGDGCRWLLPWLSLFVSLGLIVMGLVSRLPNRWEQVGYGFILSGALGNGIDRLRAGEVVDFIQAFPVTRFPIFNMADVWINVGIACLFLTMVLFPQPSEKPSDRRPRR